MPPTLVAFIPNLLARSGKKSVALVGLTLASLVIPEAAHAAGVLAPDPVIESGIAPHDVIPAEGPTANTVSATTSVPELSPSPQFSANQGSAQLLAQAITPANDGTGTVVTQTGNTFDITGGTSAGANLFHSFGQLGLDAGQAANIIANPSVANVLGRVVGGDPSVINGLLQVTGGNANLFLMNPAGIIFGPQSQVIVPGAFTATTASAIELGDYWFNALGSNEYANLVAAPSGFAFVNSQPNSEPGAIINAGTLDGQSVILLGGFVVNTGTIEVGDGNISIAAVPGERLVHITQENSLLSIELPIADSLSSEMRDTLAGTLQGLTILDIPTLLSSGNVLPELGLTLEDGTVKLAATDNVISTTPGSGVSYISGGNISLGNYSSNLPLRVEATGDIIGRNIEARSIELSARNNISIENGLEASFSNSFNSSDNSVILRTEYEDIQVGFINGRFGGISVESGRDFRVTSFSSPFHGGENLSIVGAFINLIAKNDISVEDGIVVDLRGFSDNGNPVNINTDNGTIEVGFIKAGWGGIDITSGGFFRATGSFVDDNYNPFFFNTILVNPDLVEFLVEHGHDRGQVLAFFENRSFGAGLELSLRATAFSNLPEGSQNAPISIRFGNANEEFVNEQFEIFGVPSYIRILGDSSQTFSLGPRYENGVRFTSTDPDRNLRPYDLNTNPTGLDLSAEFPFELTEFFIEPNSAALLSLLDGASGTVAGIAVRGDNSGLYGSVQSRLFLPPISELPTPESPISGLPTPEPPSPEPPISEPPISEPPISEPPISEPPISEPSSTELASTQNLDVAANNLCDDEIVARTFDSDILDVDESLISELSTNEASATANPCTSSVTSSEPGNTLEASPPGDLETFEPTSSNESFVEAVDKSVDTSEAAPPEESELLDSASSGEGTSATPVENSTEASSKNEGAIIEVPEVAIRVEPVIDAPARNLSVETVETRPVFSSSSGQTL